MNLRSLLLSALLLIPAAACAQTVELDAVLDRMIEAYGGEQNLRKLGHAHQEWDVEALARHTRGTEVRDIRLPGWLKVELTYPDRKEERTLNGDEAFIAFGGAHPSPATPPQRDAMRLQMMRLYSPLALRERTGALRMESAEGYHVLSLEENGLRADYLVNGESWRIEKVIGTLQMGGQNMQFFTEYSDFQVVEGVLMHHAENKFAGQVNTARLQLRRIRFGGEDEQGKLTL